MKEFVFFYFLNLTLTQHISITGPVSVCSIGSLVSTWVDPFMDPGNGRTLTFMLLISLWVAIFQMLQAEVCEARIQPNSSSVEHLWGLLLQSIERALGGGAAIQVKYRYIAVTRGALMWTVTDDIRGGHSPAVRYNDGPDRDRPDSWLCWKHVLRFFCWVLQTNLLCIQRSLWWCHSHTHLPVYLGSVKGRKACGIDAQLFLLWARERESLDILQGPSTQR